MLPPERNKFLEGKASLAFKFFESQQGTSLLYLHFFPLLKAKHLAIKEHFRGGKKQILEGKKS
jgi:hypothetical protein